ncbi:MAG: hypothetical protein J6Q49_02070 [Kiritimatiellae bacterium]|nr:hypothetical protein [Kiritimatiellia bacterium]
MNLCLFFEGTGRGAADRKVILVNATGKAGLYAKLPACPRMIRVFDVTGRETQAEIPSAGLVSLPVPSSGYAELALRDRETPLTSA